MASIERLNPTHRFVLVVALLCVLFGLFVWSGTVEPDPGANHYPDGEYIAEDPEAYLGERVSVSGTVVSHDPLRIEEEYGVDATLTLEIRDVDDPPPVGHHLSVFGTLDEADPGVVHAETTVTQAPWEAIYMYVVSFLGGLWVLWRLLTHWRVDRNALAIVPRGDSDA